MKINLKKLIWIQIILLFTIRFIISVTKIDKLSIICDIVLISISVMLVYHYSQKKVPQIAIYVCINIIFFIFSFVYGSRTNIINFFYMFREFFRVYIFFLAVQVAFTKEDFEKVFLLFDIVTVIHFIMVLIQLFIFKVPNGDYVGGIFGIVYGYGNSASHALLLLITMITMYKYFSGIENFKISILKMIMVFSIGMLTEMKSIIFEIFLIIALFIILEKRIKLKNILIILVLMLMSISFVKYMEQRFNFNILSFESINKYLNSGYGNNTDGIGRTNGLSKIYELCFKNNKIKLFFGYGLGSATSAVTNNLYGNINLEYFTYAKLFYEIGLIGLIIYFGFYLICIMEAIKMKSQYMQLSILAISACIIGIYLNFYGSFMESDFSGYFMYMMFALPFVIKKENQK